MSIPERLVALAFLVSVLTVFAVGAVILAGHALRLVGLGAPWLPRVPRALQAVVLSLAALGILCMAYGYFVEPYWLQVTRVRITSGKLPTGTRPLRIVHVSDLHCDPRVRLEDRLPQAVARERPDLILFTGDTVNSPATLPVFKRCISALARMAPTFAVRGNWDVWYWGNLDLYGQTGVRLLNGEGVMLTVKGARVWVTGVDYGAADRIGLAVGPASAGVFTILLYHSPDGIAQAARSGADLWLAGHTHGGQVALPFYGALVTLSSTGKKYESGLYRVGGTWLYVNRGIGMEGGLPRVRFLARPELTVIEIAPQVP